MTVNCKDSQISGVAFLPLQVRYNFLLQILTYDNNIMGSEIDNINEIEILHAFDAQIIFLINGLKYSKIVIIRAI